MTHAPFVGTWRLVSCIWEGPDGRITYPYGRSPVGYLIYTDDGYMAVNFMSSGRHRFASEQRFEATGQEERRARKTYQSYSGRYEVRGDRMIHHVEVSLFPNWVGRDQERIYRLEGDRLCLSTDPLPFGNSHQIARLEWERVSTPQAAPVEEWAVPAGSGGMDGTAQTHDS
ncbi:MAG TPA: lipocalin-like domain-containing protein [Chloroflexota bacterium]